MEYNKWEWALRKQVHTWALEAETKILNHGKFDTSEKLNIEVKYDLESEADAKLTKGEKEIIDKITSYYEQGEGHVELVERYRQDFINSATSLKKELLNLISTKLDAALSRRNGMIKVEGIKKTYMDTMEKKVLDLLEDCRKTKSHMSDAALDKAFQNMWLEKVKTLPILGQQTQNIVSRVLSQLRKNLDARGSAMAQSLDTVTDLNTHGHEKFVVSKGNFFTNFIGYHNKWIKRAQNMVDTLINDCRQFVEEKKESRDDYDDTYIREVLNMIDDKLKAHEDLKVNEQSELSLKLHICGFASRDFQEIHNQFILDNDPLKALEKHKETYRSDFIDLFHERDQCQKKADEFTKTCLKPAIEKYRSKVLGRQMADKMLLGENSQVFGSRILFQNSVLKSLIEEFHFNRYVDFIEFYEVFVKDFILDKVVKYFSAEKRMLQLEEKLMDVVISEINQAIENTEKNQDMKGFIQNICSKLKHRLDLPKDAVDRISSLTNVNTKNITECLKYSVNEMVTSMKARFQGDIKRKLKDLQEEPQDVLFKRVQGCGKQCPFCKAPCEAGGEDHAKHFLSIHRPEGLGHYRDSDSGKLVTDICTSSVHSCQSFKCHETKGQWHPFSKYREIYPDWTIDPDSSIEAFVYWKYVMTQFNEQLAERYNAKPADIPSAWKSITKSQAEESLK
ncbi:hypothetical protein IRJ41_011583 [Triplophysa rosa]|uniref:Interferon-induced very large GTPase 1 domain-containing protein n=2 Tax=Triplophysa rosa TaxID=992332 RepID=A0A9W7TB93_TRIRA|nr:hypothetical protein IRJ41_011583 [Triplophysa rosa]